VGEALKEIVEATAPRQGGGDLIESVEQEHPLAGPGLCESLGADGRDQALLNVGVPSHHAEGYDGEGGQTGSALGGEASAQGRFARAEGAQQDDAADAWVFEVSCEGGEDFAHGLGAEGLALQD